MSNTTIRIDVCARCKGAGTELMSELTNYHKGEYDEWTVTCRACKGSGRIKETTVVTREAFVPQPPER